MPLQGPQTTATTLNNMAPPQNHQTGDADPDVILAQLDALIVNGAQPNQIAQLMHEHPDKNNEMLTRLHQTEGNAFVAQVVNILHGPRSSDMMYLGLNDGAKYEAAELKRDVSPSHGNVTTIVSPPDLQGADRTAFLATLGLDNATLTKVMTFLDGVGSDGALWLQVIAVYARANRGEIHLDRMVLSGHHISLGHLFGGSYELEFAHFDELAAIFPIAAGGVHHLMTSACYTANLEEVAMWLKAFPNLETVWGYAGESPLGAYAAPSHMKTWEQDTRSSSVTQYDPKASVAANHLANADVIAVWSRATDKFVGVNSHNVTTSEMVRHIDEEYETIYLPAFNGTVEPKDGGTLRQYYNHLHMLYGNANAQSYFQYTSGNSEEELQSKIDVTIRLIHYPMIAANFAARDGATIAKGYQAIGKTAPNFGAMGRIAALKEIQSFGDAVGSYSGPNLADANAALTLLQSVLRDLDPKAVPQGWVDAPAEAHQAAH